MAENKKSFVLYTDMIHTVKKMAKSPEGKIRVADLFITILEYVNDMNPVPDDPTVDLVFEPLKHQLKRDLKKYERTVESKKENGAMGNLKRWNPDLHQAVEEGKMTLQAAIFEADERKANGSKVNRKPSRTSQGVAAAINLSRNVANVADNDNVTDNVNESVIEKQAKLLQSYFSDLPNSQLFENTCRATYMNKTQLLPFIEKFKMGGAKVSYPSFTEFANHFNFWVQKKLREDKPAQTVVFKKPFPKS